MGTFIPMFVATHLLLDSLDRVSNTCKWEVRVTFETQRGIYWTYPFLTDSGRYLENKSTKFSLAIVNILDCQSDS